MNKDHFWKDKKIIAYVALKHHTRFIIPVMEKLSQLGADTRYVVAQAERSQEITAVECRLNYAHVFDYLDENDFQEVQENYLRERRVFSKALCSDFALAAQMVTVTDKTLYAMAQEYIGFRNMIRDEKPDLCFALHELNRWGKTLAFWAKKFNVPFISLQEGLGYNQSFGYTGHVQYSTLDLVWGERIKKKFSDYEAPVERIIPVGNTHISREKEYQTQNNIRQKMRKELKLNGKLVPLLIFTSTPPDHKQIAPLLERVARLTHVKMIIKFHPACKYPTYEAWESAVPKPWRKSLVLVHGEYTAYDLMSASDVCVLAAPSTTGIEAIALGKPLVQLSGLSGTETPYSFVDQGVAFEMTPEKLGEQLAQKADFKKDLSVEAIDIFLKNELTHTIGADDRIINIMQTAIQASAGVQITPLTFPEPAAYEWTLVIPVPAGRPDDFLFQLESVTRHSEGQGNYEVLLIEPENISPEISVILDSLSGDVIRIKVGQSQNIWETINNQAVQAMRGEKIAIFTELVSPMPHWLTALNKAFSTYGAHKIFGGKVINAFGSIIHAGIILNTNNAPVSAYQHLDHRFPQANIERAFMMLDHLVCLSRTFFSDLGGFSPRTGANALMDLCLKAGFETKDTRASIFLPDLQLLKKGPAANTTAEDAIHFYARWHGVLWANEDALYKQDGITRQQLDAARMARAQKIAGRI